MTLVENYSIFADLCRYFINHLLERIHIWAIDTIHSTASDTWVHAPGLDRGQILAHLFFLFHIIICISTTGTVLAGSDFRP